MNDLIRRTIDILRVDGDRWRALATGVDRELLARQPEPGDVVGPPVSGSCHGHRGCRLRGHAFGPSCPATPSSASYDPDEESTPIAADTDPAALAERHTALRAQSLALLSTVTQAELDRTAHHAEFGPVTLRELLNEWAAHDLMHLIQAERAVMQAFIPSSGPWRPSFADHDVARPSG